MPWLWQIVALASPAAAVAAAAAALPVLAGLAPAAMLPHWPCKQKIAPMSSHFLFLFLSSLQNDMPPPDDAIEASPAQTSPFIKSLNGSLRGTEYVT